MSTAPTPVIITGAAGRMGKRLISLAMAQPDRLKVVGAVDRADSPFLNQDAAQVAGAGSNCGVLILPSMPNSLPASPRPVIIDFSVPAATRQTLKTAVERKWGMLIGTTGLTADDQKLIDEAGKTIPILQAGNTGLGINVLLAVVAQIAQKLGPDFDIEILEAHHNQKKDAPSGTAMALAESICKGTGRDLEKDLDYGRHGHEAKRIPGSIGMNAIRGGDIVGEHTVMYAGTGERIEVKHIATSRDVFASGALRAAQFLSAQQPGRYTMTNVLGL